MADALKSLRDGTKKGKRPTRVHTPQYLLDIVAELWPEGIALDPAGSPDGLVKAARIVCPPDDGLLEDWQARTFVNPPYDNLKPWLFRYSWAPPEVILLVPVRTHRKWFREAMRWSNEVVYLDPVAFVGEGNVFPGPLCFLYNGHRGLQKLCLQHGVTS